MTTETIQLTNDWLSSPGRAAEGPVPEYRATATAEANCADQTAWWKSHGEVYAQHQSRSRRLVIVEEPEGLSVARLQRRSYPMTRVCFAAGHTVESLKAALSEVSPVTTDVDSWESAIRAAI